MKEGRGERRERGGREEGEGRRVSGVGNKKGTGKAKTKDKGSRAGSVFGSSSLTTSARGTESPLPSSWSVFSLLWNYFTPSRRREVAQLSRAAPLLRW